ncbi:ABC transporter permease [Cellulomonas endophytica]|uniref:ABC transporter permease n=1 Tax=Cellulomonas endophytica TaxID=2494735 RepID=UPI001010DB3C|nr:ABC transporter permease [Cellulomonas endophytica]
MSATALVEPGRGRGLLDVLDRRFLLRLLVKKELRVRYRGSALGMLWSYVKPATQFLAFYLALGVFLELNRGTEDYAVYLFSGIVVINYFGEGFGNATRSVVGNAPLVKKVYLPRELFPAASVWVSAVHLLPQVLVLLVGAVGFGWRPDLGAVVAAVLAFVMVTLLALGLGMLAGAVNVLFRDAENLVDLVIMLATWVSPVLYTWDRVAAVLPGWVFTLYQLNPLTVAVELSHRAFWWPATSREAALPPHLLWTGLLGLGVSVLVVLVGQLVFRRLEGRFAQEL